MEVGKQERMERRRRRRRRGWRRRMNGGSIDGGRAEVAREDGRKE